MWRDFCERDDFFFLIASRKLQQVLNLLSSYANNGDIPAIKLNKAKPGIISGGKWSYKDIQQEVKGGRSPEKAIDSG